jgi:hypothetical protein
MFSSRKRGLHGLGPTPLSEAEAVPFMGSTVPRRWLIFSGHAEMAYTLQFACELIHTSKAFHAMVWASGLWSFAMKTFSFPSIKCNPDPARLSPDDVTLVIAVLQGDN